MARQKAQIALVCFAGLLLAGCATFSNPFAGLQSPPQEPKKLAHWTQREEIKPAPGCSHGEHIVREYTAGYEEAQPKRTFFQKVWGQFGLWTILIVLACIFIPGFAGLMALLLGRVRGAAGQMVNGIEDFLKSDAPEEAKKKLLETLSKSYDNGTKKFVAEVKAAKRR